MVWGRQQPSKKCSRKGLAHSIQTPSCRSDYITKSGNSIEGMCRKSNSWNANPFLFYGGRCLRRGWTVHRSRCRATHFQPRWNWIEHKSKPAEAFLQEVYKGCISEDTNLRKGDVYCACSWQYCWRVSRAIGCLQGCTSQWELDIQWASRNRICRFPQWVDEWHSLRVMVPWFLRAVL